MKHQVYGSLEFQNGNKIDWLQFIDENLTRKQAEAEAVRIVAAQHKGDFIKSITSNAAKLP